MTIEISAPAPASTTGSKPAACAQNTQTVGEAPAVSFLSLLGAMGLGAEDATALMTAMPGTVVARAKPMADGSASTESGQDDSAPMAALAQLPLAADWWTPAGSMAALAQTAATASTAETAATAATAATGTTAATTASVPGASTELSAHAGATGQRPGTGLAAASAQARAVDATQQAGAEAALSKPTAGFNATSELQQLPAQALTVQQDGGATPVSSRDFMARVEAARLAADPDTATLRAANTPLGGGQSLTQVVSMFDATALGLRASGALRGQERNQSRMGAPGAAQAMVTWGDATPAGTQHGASPVYAPGALTPAPATAMAEKVHYWVSRGVQSASLQLDAFAGGSVDVSIAVKGDEAIIEFRTDQPQARQLLLEAMPQLKELLANEGLLLSGGFVGNSQQQDGQSQGRGTPETAPRESVVGTLQASPGRAGAPGGLSGGSVDLFV